MLTKIEHVAIVVSNLDAAIEVYTKTWGLPLVHREVVEDQGVEEAMLALGDSHIQLLCPLSPNTTVGRFLAKSGEGLHHIAYEVENLEAALESLRGQGVALIDEEPRRGSRNTRIAFVHPKSNRGLLVELVELAKASGP